MFLVRQQDVRRVVLIERPIGCRQEEGAACGVVVAEVIKVAGHLEVRLVRDRPLAADFEPAVASDQPIEPILENPVGLFLVAPEPEGQVADL